MRLWRAKLWQTANTQITLNTYAGHKRKQKSWANKQRQLNSNNLVIHHHDALYQKPGKHQEYRLIQKIQSTQLDSHLSW